MRHWFLDVGFVPGEEKGEPHNRFNDPKPTLHKDVFWHLARFPFTAVHAFPVGENVFVSLLLHDGRNVSSIQLGATLTRSNARKFAENILAALDNNSHS